MNSKPQREIKAQQIKFKHEHIVDAIGELQRVEGRVLGLLAAINRNRNEPCYDAKMAQPELENLSQVLSETPRLIYDSVSHIESVLRQIEISLFGEN